MTEIRLAIAGLGNCASSLLQGIEYYKDRDLDTAGLLFDDVGGYRVESIKPIVCFDIDSRKVGKPMHEAVFAEPNCTTVFQKELPDWGVTVQMAPVLDGVAAHMADYPEARAFRVSDAEPVDIAQVLKDNKIDVLACYLPVGSEEAVKHYATACLDAGVAMVNCMPVFIASHPEWGKRFTEAGVPIVGDDIKSQVGATIVHRQMARLMGDRGVALRRTYQLNTGGNTDFLNMVDQGRLKTKKISKTESVQSQLGTRLADEDIHIGPSDYVPFQKDNKVCFLRMEWDGFGGVPMHIEARLSVEDSPNSGGVVIDAIRAAKLALDRKQGGPLIPACAFWMKHPPKQLRDSDALQDLESWIKTE